MSQFFNITRMLNNFRFTDVFLLYYDKSIADGYTLKIIREDIETSYKERLSDVYDKLDLS